MKRNLLRVFMACIVGVGTATGLSAQNVCRAADDSSFDMIEMIKTYALATDSIGKATADSLGIPAVIRREHPVDHEGSHVSIREYGLSSRGDRRDSDAFRTRLRRAGRIKLRRLGSGVSLLHHRRRIRCVYVVHVEVGQEKYLLRTNR
jgi:hypothetical protein